MIIDEADYFVSHDEDLLDFDYTIALIKKQYWGGWRSEPLILKSLHNSLCFGLYERDGSYKYRQIGFARVVTDQATFSWLCDVVVDEAHRGKGLGKFLVSQVLAHPQVKSTVFLLRTRDAHGLYEQLGWQKCEAMQRIPSNGQ